MSSDPNLKPIKERAKTRTGIVLFGILFAFIFFCAGLFIFGKIPLYIWMLDSPDQQSRQMAVLLLEREGEKVLPQLIGVLKKSKEDWVLREVAILLGKIGTPAIPPLLKCLDHPRQAVRTKAGAALARMGTLGAEELLKNLPESPDRVRCEIVGSLCLMGPIHPKILYTLLNSMEDPYWRVRWEAVHAFFKPEFWNEIESREAAQILLKKLLKDPSVPVRYISARVLSQQKLFPTEVIAVLKQGILLPDEKSEPDEKEGEEPTPNTPLSPKHSKIRLHLLEALACYPEKSDQIRNILEALENLDTPLSSGVQKKIQELRKQFPH